MKLTFENKTSFTVRLLICGEGVSIPPLGEGSFDIAEGRVEFSLYPEVKSDVIYALAKFGIILKRFFSLKTEYAFEGDSDGKIIITEEKKKGRFMEEYLKAVVKSDSFDIKIVHYSVWDEESIKAKLVSSAKRGDRALKVFNVLDIVGNGFTCLLILIIPFILIWIFGDIRLAAKICGYAFIPLMAGVILLNRFFDKIKRKLWNKAKSITLKKEIFKDYNSYFDNEYIKSVFGRN